MLGISCGTLDFLKSQKVTLFGFSVVHWIFEISKTDICGILNSLETVDFLTFGRLKPGIRHKVTQLAPKGPGTYAK